ncbi:MAG: relaxase/mobilization nuclease domain-containing protein [Acutalibacteraceae bacterium]|nr:relaxase/mobilization nuclease domain-containing protein [Acutalibacteraceae bacterium]
MAVSKAWTIKTGIKDSVNYVADTDKTSVMRYIKNETKTVYGDKILVSGHLCNPQTAELEFKMREEAYHAVKKENIAKGVQPNQAIHIIQSFSSKDSANMTPEQLHQYGLEFAGMICGEHFQAVVASHLNHPDQLHNHIIINAYALDGIYKFIEDRNCLKRVRELNDLLCTSHGLEVIIPEKLDKVGSYKEWQEKQNGTSWKEAIRTDIKEAMKATNSWYDFKTALEQAGYKIIENEKTVSYQAPGGYTVTDKKLGKTYERASLLEYWNERELEPERERPIIQPDPVKKNVDITDIYVNPYDDRGRRRGPIEILLLQVLKKLKFMQKHKIEPDVGTIDSAVFGRVDWKIQNMLDTLALTKENNIQTQEDLKERISELGATRNNLKIKLDGDNVEIQNMEATIRDISDFLELEEIVDNIYIDGSLLNVEMPDIETIREARAAQDPMTKRQKMELFKLMEQETEFKLDAKFGQISRTEAVDVIAFLKDKTKERPPLVITIDEFNAKREQALEGSINKNKQLSRDARLEKTPATPKQRILVQKLLQKHPEIKLKREITNQKDATQVLDYFNNGGEYPDVFVSSRDIEISKLSPEDQITVNGYLELKEKLYSLGLTDMDKIKAYKSELKEKVNRFAQEKEEFKEMGQKYAKFKRMEYNVELAKNPAYTKVEKAIDSRELESDSGLDKEVEKTSKENNHNYRTEDKYFHNDDER